MISRETSVSERYRRAGRRTPVCVTLLRNTSEIMYARSFRMYELRSAAERERRREKMARAAEELSMSPIVSRRGRKSKRGSKLEIGRGRSSEKAQKGGMERETVKMFHRDVRLRDGMRQMGPNGSNLSRGAIRDRNYYESGVKARVPRALSRTPGIPQYNFRAYPYESALRPRRMRGSS